MPNTLVAERSRSHAPCPVSYSQTTSANSRKAGYLLSTKLGMEYNKIVNIKRHLRYLWIMQVWKLIQNVVN
ncbi:hypothetical protein H6G41_06110 [Tolypothrix sp. FACHB-123]|nr:hypothetical protein [Tolypothrix sp. FACHB-123]